MQQKAIINLRPRYFKLMLTGICTRLIVTFRLSVSKEMRKEKLIVMPDLGEEGSPMQLAGIIPPRRGLWVPWGMALTSLVNSTHTVLFKCFESCMLSFLSLI